jgi:hypothetical protein
MPSTLHDRPRATSVALTLLNIGAWLYAAAHTLPALG